jgi:DNA-directed RNA polymerase subunit M/transcription elongation factor TFIIS
MRFCPDCKNMLYYIEAGAGGIELKCRNCQYSEASPTLLYEHNLREDTTAHLIVNPYLAQDPTLPRFKTIKCPNDTCTSNDVVGVKIDAVNVVWMYQCAVCSTSWKQSAHRG